jgi:DNA-binding beta-propeller fold protein YncE
MRYVALVLASAAAVGCGASHGHPATAVVSAAPAPLHGTLVAANMNDNTATVLDLASHRTVVTLPTGKAPHEVAISHDGHWAVVSNYGLRDQPGNSLTVIDLEPAVPVVVRTIDLGEYHRPHGSAFLPGDTTMLVTVEANQAVLVVNIAAGRVSAVIPTTQKGSHMVALTADGRRAFTTNVGDGTISELDIADRAFVRIIPVAPAVEGIAVSPGGDQVWVASNKAKNVSVVIPASASIADTVGGFGLPYRMAITPDSRTAIITDPGSGVVRFVNTATRAEIGRLPFPPDSLVPTAEVPGSSCPEGIVVTPDGRTAFVTLQGRNRVVAIDIASRTVVGMMPTGVWSDGVGYSTVDR